MRGGGGSGEFRRKVESGDVALKVAVDAGSGG